MAAKKIQVTQVDHERLMRLIDSMRNVSTQDQVFLDKLRSELDRAGYFV